MEVEAGLVGNLAIFGRRPLCHQKTTIVACLSVSLDSDKDTKKSSYLHAMYNKKLFFFSMAIHPNLFIHEIYLYNIVQHIDFQNVFLASF